MRQHTVTYDKNRWILWDDGHLICEGALIDEVEHTLMELLFVIQEFQNAFGSIPTRMLPYNWQGIK